MTIAIRPRRVLKAPAPRVPALGPGMTIKSGVRPDSLSGLLLRRRAGDAPTPAEGRSPLVADFLDILPALGVASALTVAAIAAMMYFGVWS
jgi:hypothetical protein